MESLDQIILEPADGKILGSEVTVESIRESIVKLSDLKDQDLKVAMVRLKAALRANPEACNLLLPEEIGVMVAKIYEMTKTVIVQVAAKKSTSNSKKIDLKSIKEMPADF